MISLLAALLPATLADGSGAGIALVRAEAGLSGPAGEEAALELAHALERRGLRVVSSTGSLERCGPWTSCLDRLGVQEGVILRLYAGPTLLRASAQRLGAGGAELSAAELEVARQAGEWAAACDRLAAALYPVVVAEATPPLPGISPVPWVLAGLSLGLGAAGLGFGLSSEDAREEARGGPRFPAEQEALRARAADHALAANLLFAGAGVGAALALTLFLLE